MKIKAFLDTNVLMDILQKGRPSSECSSVILQAVYDNRIEAVITSQSIIDASYLAFKAGGGPLFLETLKKWIYNINTDQIDTFDILWAIRHYSGDFEDDAQVSRALETYCDVFITGDKGLRNKYKGKYDHLLFMSPEEFVAIMKGEVPPPAPAQIKESIE